jgi:hypothetical protein
MITVDQARTSIWPLDVHGDGQDRSMWLYHCKAEPRLGRLDIIDRATGQRQTIWSAIGDERGFASLEEAVAALPTAEAA